MPKLEPNKWNDQILQETQCNVIIMSQFVDKQALHEWR